MGLEKVTVQFTAEELKELMNSRLNRRGIEINEVTLNENINVAGKLSFMKALPSLNVEGELKIVEVKDGNLYLEIKKFSFLKKDFSNLVQKSIDKIINVLDKDGISRDGNSIVIEMQKVLAQLDVANTEIYNIYVEEGSLKLDTDNKDLLSAI